MHKTLCLKKICLFWMAILCIGFSTFAQAPYNVIINISQDPKTQMAFNWFTEAGKTGGRVEVMLGGNVVKTVYAINYIPLPQIIKTI